MAGVEATEERVEHKIGGAALEALGVKSNHHAAVRSADAHRRGRREQAAAGVGLPDSPQAATLIAGTHSLADTPARLHRRHKIFQRYMTLWNYT